MKGVVCNVYQQPVDKETGGGPALSLEPDVMRLLGDPLWGEELQAQDGELSGPDR